MFVFYMDLLDSIYTSPFLLGFWFLIFFFRFGCTCIMYFTFGFLDFSFVFRFGCACVFDGTHARNRKRKKAYRTQHIVEWILIYPHREKAYHDCHITPKNILNTHIHIIQIVIINTYIQKQI